MKEIIKESFKKLVADRYLLALLAGLILFCLVLATIIGFSVQPREVQIVSHYSAFGVSRYYLDQWFYLILFVAFELVIAVFHSIISVKLLVEKGRSLAIMFAWYGFGIAVIGFITSLAVINAWKP